MPRKPKIFTGRDSDVTRRPVKPRSNQKSIGTIVIVKRNGTEVETLKSDITPSQARTLEGANAIGGTGEIGLLDQRTVAQESNDPIISTLRTQPGVYLPITISPDTGDTRNDFHVKRAICDNCGLPVAIANAELVDSPTIQGKVLVFHREPCKGVSETLESQAAKQTGTTP